MLEKANTFLSGIGATLIGGVFLLLSFILPKIGISVTFDPAWITVLL